MISQLTIQNFGLIDRLAIEFNDQLNIFTGETGAGKSILIDALRYCLGEKINSSQIRDTNSPCIVEGVFDLTDKQLKESPIFSEYASSEEPLIIIKRSFLPSGRNKNSINGFTVTTAQLKELGNHLVDLHGPHDHQMLFSEDSHIEIVDKLSDLEGLKKDFNSDFQEFKALNKKLDNLTDMAASSEREMDLLKHQIKELEQVPLDANSYELLLQEQTRINNSEKLYEYANQLLTLLENEQSGISEIASQAFSPLTQLNDIDESTSNMAEILSRIQEDSQELVSSITEYIEGLSFNSHEAEEIKNKYDIYYELLRKYGPALDDAKKFYDSALEKYNLIVDIEHNDSSIRKEISLKKKKLTDIAQKISVKRKKTAALLKETIEKELKELGIKNVKFECRIEKTELNPLGQDQVTFFISPNIGEELKPLAEIVSSGEAARVMLALKKALTKVDPIPVLIFDEIDAQIGGRLGNITGKKLKELSDDRQVILITHLPQIASFGDSHFMVEKGVKDNRTFVKVAALDKKTRIKELARMMSGEKETTIAVKHAEEMLKSSR